MYKTFNCLIFGVCTVLLLCNSALALRVQYDPSTMLYPISVQQAEQAARTWMGDQNLQFNLLGVEKLATDYYVLKSTDGNEQFLIDCVTGNVHYWRNITAAQALDAKLHDYQDESTWKTKDELNNTIRQFLAAKYPNFISLNMQLPDDNFPESLYTQRLENGVWFQGNRVGCKIDRWTGQIVSYMAWSVPGTSISTQYSVTSQQAEQTALAHAATLELAEPSDTEETIYSHPRSIFVLDNEGVWVNKDDEGVEHIGWVIDVIVSLETNFTLESYNTEHQTTEEPNFAEGMLFAIVVDANTGAIISAEQATAPPPFVATPSISPDGTISDNSQVVTISCATPNAVIRYTTDGTEPSATSNTYTGPITLSPTDHTVTLKTKAWKTCFLSSPTTSARSLAEKGRFQAARDCANCGVALPTAQTNLDNICWINRMDTARHALCSLHSP